MGGKQSVFTENELDDYQELTYFTKKEILHAHKRFSQLDPASTASNKNARLDQEKIEDLHELKVNPFKDRICKVFSSSSDGNMTFEDFLDMMSVFSENAPKNVKVEYAFRIYDFDGDDVISTEDVKQVINRLTGDQQLSPDDMNQLIQNVFEEADLDDDDSLSFAEFEHAISKAPDFVKYVNLIQCLPINYMTNYIENINSSYPGSRYFVKLCLFILVAVRFASDSKSS